MGSTASAGSMRAKATGSNTSRQGTREQRLHRLASLEVHHDGRATLLQLPSATWAEGIIHDAGEDENLGCSSLDDLGKGGCPL